MEINLDDIEYVGETSITIRKSRRRITVPKEVAEQLELLDSDRIRWILFKDGRLYLSKADKLQQKGQKSNRE